MTDVESTTSKSKIPHGFSTTSMESSTSNSSSLPKKAGIHHRIHPEASSALDALAALASTHHMSSLSQQPLSLIEEETSSIMPPPLPRTNTAMMNNPRGGRLRSCSNPEGMEKWSLGTTTTTTRRHFVLPPSMLEQELRMATHACREYQERKIQEEEEEEDEEPSGKTVFQVQKVLGTSPDSVASPLIHAVKEEEDDDEEEEQEDSEEEQEQEDESNLDPQELLRRARNRLFDDLAASQGVEKGVMPLPHSLEKYKEIYNKNGRIGIYTPTERAAIIAKFNSKRTRRVWNKKIRYSCRKNLADSRMRVKGRFVKRSQQLQATKEGGDLSTESSSSSSASSSGSNSPLPEGTSRSSTSGGGGPLEPVLEGHEIRHSMTTTDVDMPDVNDPEAGFCPTPSQPFRRTRRHTIT